jgi:putative oxidoreductase
MRLDIGLLLLRLATGGTMVVAHGLGKLMSYSGMLATFPDPLGIGSRLTLTIAIFAEVFCSLLIVIGLSTRLATLPLIGTMFSAFFIVHMGDAWNVREPAFIYGMAFVVLFCTGPGALSMDGLIRLKKVIKNS